MGSMRHAPAHQGAGNKRILLVTDFERHEGFAMPKVVGVVNGLPNGGEPSTLKRS